MVLVTGVLRVKFIVEGEKPVTVALLPVTEILVRLVIVTHEGKERLKLDRLTELS